MAAACGRGTALSAVVGLMVIWECITGGWGEMVSGQDAGEQADSSFFSYPPLRIHAEFQGVEFLLPHQRAFLTDSYIPQVTASVGRFISALSPTRPGQYLSLSTPCAVRVPGSVTECETWAPIPTHCGPAAHNPEFFGAVETCQVVGGRTVCRVEERGTGVRDVDFILYVFLTDGGDCVIPELTAFGGPCGSETLDPRNRRPLAGFLNLCTRGLQPNVRGDADGQQLDTGVHAVLQALAFHLDLLPYYHAAFAGEPASLVTRDRQTYLAAPMVTQEARAHYDCPTMPGMPVEGTLLREITYMSEDAVETNYTEKLIFWESRLAYGELMTSEVGFRPGVTHRGNSLARSTWDRALLSRLTLALLEDTGWYKLEWDAVAPLSFGLAAGCEFLRVGVCADEVESSPAVYSQSVSVIDTATPVCTFDGLAIGTWRAPGRLWDGCAVARYYSFQPDVGFSRRCEDGENALAVGAQLQYNERSVFGTQAGLNSRCLGATDLKRRVYTSANKDALESRVFRRDQSMTTLDCFQMECQLNDHGLQEVWLVLPIKSPPVKILCPAGELLSVSESEALQRNGYEDGTLGPCPNPELVCPGLSCPAGCSRNGVCHSGRCFCNLGWTGADCSIPSCNPNSCSGASPNCHLRTGICQAEAEYQPVPTAPPTPPPTSRPAPRTTAPTTTTAALPPPLSTPMLTSAPPPIAISTTEPPPSPPMTTSPIPDPYPLSEGDTVVEQRFHIERQVVGEEQLRSARRLVSAVTEVQAERIYSSVYYRMQGALSSPSSPSNVTFNVTEAEALLRTLVHVLDMSSVALSVTLIPPEMCLSDTASGDAAIPCLTFSVPSISEVQMSQYMQLLSASLSDGKFLQQMHIELARFLSSTQGILFGIRDLRVSTVLTLRVRLANPDEATSVVSALEEENGSARRDVIKAIASAVSDGDTSVVWQLSNATSIPFSQLDDMLEDDVGGVRKLNMTTAEEESRRIEIETGSDSEAVPVWAWLLLAAGICLVAATVVFAFYLRFRKRTAVLLNPYIKSESGSGVSLHALPPSPSSQTKLLAWGGSDSNRSTPVSSPSRSPLSKAGGRDVFVVPDITSPPGPVLGQSGLLSQHAVACLSPPATPSNASVRQHPYRSHANSQSWANQDTPAASKDGAPPSRPASRGQVNLSFCTSSSGDFGGGSPGMHSNRSDTVTPVGSPHGGRLKSMGGESGSYPSTRTASPGQLISPGPAISPSTPTAGSSFLPVPVHAVNQGPAARPRSRELVPTKLTYGSP